MNPGGPGDTGVGLVRGDPEGIDAFGGGRFDVVSWDPARHQRQHPGALLPQPAAARSGSGPAPRLPTTNAASERFAATRPPPWRGAAVEVSGWLLPHISTADTARDLDHLRVLIGEDKLTYVGLSYGTFLGQTYANMFPDRVRAMLLDGIVDAPKVLEGGRGEERQRVRLGR